MHFLTRVFSTRVIKHSTSFQTHKLGENINKMKHIIYFLNRKQRKYTEKLKNELNLAISFNNPSNKSFSFFVFPTRKDNDAEEI